MSGILNADLMRMGASGASAGSGAFYNGIATQSLRFDDGSSPYLTKTFSAGTSTGSGATCTVSCWVKRTTISNNDQWFFTAGSSSPAWLIGFRANDNLAFGDDDGNPFVTVTTRVFRDTSAWYHIVLRVKTSESANADKYKFYVNGELQATTFSGSPANTLFGTNVIHNIGRYPTGSAYFDGYMSDLNFVDGLALDASYFGESKKGVWIAKEPDVSEYGTNGFRFKYIGTGTGTSSGAVSSPQNIGDDSSGKNNHFAVSGLAIDDSNMPDSPENNFCTWNFISKSSGITLSEGNLKTVATTGNVHPVKTTMALPLTGKWYWEIRMISLGYLDQIGIADDFKKMVNSADGSAEGRFWGFGSWFNTYNSGVSKYQVNVASSGGTTWVGVPVPSAGNILMVAYDADNGTLWFGKDDSWYNTSGTANPATNTDPRFSSLTGHEWFPWFGATDTASTNPTYIANFGQDGSFAGALTGTAVGDETDGNGYGLFKYAPPSGFLSLCSANISDDNLPISPNTDAQANKYFQTKLYVGNGYPTTNGQTIDGVGFKSDWTWIKDRDRDGYNHYLFDSVRGATKVLRANLPNVEGTEGTALTSWNDDGFVLGANNEANYQNDDFVSWNWKAGGEPTATNSAGVGATPTTGSVKIDGANKTDALAGSIMATKISANTTSGFSIVTYTGTGATSGGVTIAHGLGKTPAMIITKKLNSVGTDYGWSTWHKDLGGNYGIWLEQVNGRNVSMWDSYSNFSSTVFGPADLNYNNVSSAIYVNYVFAEIEGYSRFGRYIGNDATNGTFVYTGFSPAFLILKYSDGTAGGTKNWLMFDNKRDTFNPNDDTINANASDGETADSNKDVDFLSNGFKLRNAEGAVNNEANYIYMAFADQPFKYANAK